MAVKTHDEASTVTAEEGEVQVDGPGGVAVSMTPEAADRTSQRLRRGAEHARGQQARSQPKE